MCQSHKFSVSQSWVSCFSLSFSVSVVLLCHPHERALKKFIERNKRKDLATNATICFFFIIFISFEWGPLHKILVSLMLLRGGNIRFHHLKSSKPASLPNRDLTKKALFCSATLVNISLWGFKSGEHLLNKHNKKYPNFRELKKILANCWAW